MRADYHPHSRRIASQHAPDKYNADRLRFFARGLRDVSVPLSNIASRLEKGGQL